MLGQQKIHLPFKRMTKDGGHCNKDVTRQLKTLMCKNNQASSFKLCKATLIAIGRSMTSLFNFMAGQPNIIDNFQVQVYNW